MIYESRGRRRTAPDSDWLIGSTLGSFHTRRPTRVKSRARVHHVETTSDWRPLHQSGIFIYFKLLLFQLFYIFSDEFCF